MKPFMNGVTAGLAFGHVVGGVFGLLVGVLSCNALLVATGLLCEAAGAYVVIQLVYERRFPFHRMKP